MTQSVEQALTNLSSRMNGVMRASLFGIARRTIEDTNVDTGRLRSNWQASAVGFTNKEVGIRTKADVQNEAKSVTSHMKTGESFYFSNNVPYAGYQEEQRGMLAKAINDLVVRTG